MTMSWTLAHFKVNFTGLHVSFSSWQSLPMQLRPVSNLQFSCQCWDCRCTLLKSWWWASLRLCHKQRIALAFVSNPKLKSIWIKAEKSNWPVQFQPSLVLKNTFVSGSKRQETTQALRSCRPSQVGPSRLTLPVQAVTLGNSTHCQCVHMWPRVGLWESQVLRGRCRDLVGRRGSLFQWFDTAQMEFLLLRLSQMHCKGGLI